MTNFFPWLSARWLIILLAFLASAGPALAQTVSKPTVLTVIPPTNTIAEDQAPMGGNVTSDGGAPITATGVIYTLAAGTITNGVLNGTDTYIGSNAGVFSKLVSGLVHGITYDFQAYARNSAGTSYGAVVRIATRPDAPLVLSPANGAVLNTRTPNYVFNSGVDMVYVTPSGGNTITFSPGQSPSLADGTYTVYGIVRFSPPNVATVTSAIPLNPSSFTISATPPTATISSPVVASSSTTTSPIPFTVTFSKSVTTFTASAITVTNGAVTTGSFSGSGATYNFTVTPTAAGSITVNIPANGARDAVGNGNTAASPYAVTYVLPSPPTVTTDTPAPGTVLETSALLGGTVTNDGGAPVTERGIVFGLGSTTLLAAGSGIGSFTRVISNLSQGTGYSFRAYATNSAGTSYGAPLIFATIPYAPTVITPTNGQVLNTRTPTYGGITSGTGVTVYVGRTVASATPLTATVGAGFSVTQPSTAPLADGTYVVYATATAGTSPPSGPSNINTFTIDAPPTATISSSAGASGSTTGTTPIPFTVTFSESVTGFAANSLSVSNGSVSGFSGSGTTYTFTVTPTTAGTATTVNVAANAAQDAGGKGNTAASPFSITYSLLVAATAWTGTTSTDWYTAGNWTAGVPTSTVDVIIPTGAPRYPLLASGAAAARSLTLNAGATLTQTDGTLDINGDLTNNGTLALTGGAVSMGATLRTNGPNILGSSASRFWNLTIQANGTLLSTSASTSVQRILTLSGAFVTQSNPLTLESNANSTAMAVNNGNNAIIGSVTVQRYIAPDLNAGLGYRHFSAPIGTATVASLATSSFTPIVNANYNTSAMPGTVTPFPTVYGYDQSRLAMTTNNLAAFDKGWFSPSAQNSALTVGQGYTVSLAANQTLSLTGPQNNGNVPLALSRNSGTTAADAGLALVGNPYPSPLDWNQVADGTDRTGLDGTIYVFESTGQYQGSYRSYNNGVGTISSVLPLGQAFFVRVTPGQTNGTLTFKNSHRPTAYSNNAYHRTSAETRPLVQLMLKGASSAVSDDAFVYFENGASDGFDAQYDAIKLPNTNGLNLSTSLTGQQFSIDGRPVLGADQRVVPLAVGVPVPGTYTITATQLLNLGAVTVYLRDLQSGALIDLTQQPSYQFAVSNASAFVTGRFELVFSPQQPLATASAALAQQVALYPNPATTSAWLELPASLGRQAVTATLLDAVGGEVRTITLPAQGTAAHQLDLHQLAVGIYVLRLNTSAGVVVKKLMVE